MAVKLKRIYDAAERADGIRILVDRLWPRGISKEQAALDEWIRDIAPSDKLRMWFGHKPERWVEFRKRYKRELKSSQKKDLVTRLRKISKLSTVTLLYGAKDDQHNNAIALAEFLKQR